MNARLGPFELVFERESEAPPHAPLFVVGPPRSGTTLLLQLVSAAFDVGYLSNLHDALWGAPSWLERLARHPLRRRSAPTFRSVRGNTAGWLEPSESPRYWSRFLPERPHCLRIDDVPPEDLARLRHSVSALSRAFDRPLVFKNVVLTGRIGPVSAALPEARFLVSQRAWVDTARSLLEARLTLFGHCDRWWSFEPFGIDELCRLDATEQVLEQVARTYAWIDRERTEVGADRFLDVSYERLCEDPAGTVDEIARFTKWERTARLLPPRFCATRKRDLPEPLDRTLLEQAERTRSRVSSRNKETLADAG